MGFPDNESLGIECPECGRDVRATIGDARRNRTVHCGAGHSIELNGREMERPIRDIEAAFKKLGDPYR